MQVQASVLSAVATFASCSPFAAAAVVNVDFAVVAVVVGKLGAVEGAVVVLDPAVEGGGSVDQSLRLFLEVQDE